MSGCSRPGTKTLELLGAAKLTWEQRPFYLSGLKNLHNRALLPLAGEEFETGTILLELGGDPSDTS